MEYKLPKVLKNILDSLLQENGVSNWRIYGGENITLSVKFHSLQNQADDTNQYWLGAEDSVPEAARQNKPLVLQYRRKSPGTIKRDIKRLEAKQTNAFNDT